MDIRRLDLPDALLDHYRRRGVRTLYPPQVAAVEAGIMDGETVVAAVPTASGKTLMAELAMLRSPGRALYLVPLRALATEKHAAFSELPGVNVAIATGDYDAPADEFADADVVVATSEKVDSLIRHGAPWMAGLSCVVVDEVHLLQSPGRGPTLEVTIAKLRALNPDLQVVALSATVANPGAIADWLDAALVETSWRPVDLRRGVSYDGRIEFDDESAAAIAAEHDDPTAALVHDAVADGGQCLVFVNSRRGAETLARALAADEFGSAPDAAAAIEETATTDVGETLAACVRRGAAFHHAGLRNRHRTAVENAFRDREIAVVCATPTLAAGVNLPARRVVVRDCRRYADSGLEPLPVLEVHQMFGRAGRPGLDPYGEALLLAESSAEAEALREEYLDGEPEAVVSKLASQEALRTHVLATVASGFAGSRSELLAVLEGTFYAAQEDQAVLIDIADLVLDSLDDAGMVRTDAGLAATDLGDQVSRLYVDPLTATRLIEALGAAAALETACPLTILEIVCDTPDMSSFYLRNRDWADVYRFAERHEPVFTKSLDAFEGAFDAWLATLKAVRVLDDWSAGDDEDAIVERHGIGPGDLRIAVERAEWLVNAAESLAAVCDIDVLDTVRETRTRLAARSG